MELVGINLIIQKILVSFSCMYLRWFHVWVIIVREYFWLTNILYDPYNIYFGFWFIEKLSPVYVEPQNGNVKISLDRNSSIHFLWISYRRTGSASEKNSLTGRGFLLYFPSSLIPLMAQLTCLWEDFYQNKFVIIENKSKDDS